MFKLNVVSALQYLLFCGTLIFLTQTQVFEFQESSVTWVELESLNGIKFTARNAHASCVYNGVASEDRIYVTGGKVDLYEMYNTLNSIKQADVWYSLDGGNWVQELYLLGDYFVQNADALQPSSLAPWYQRFGHTLDSIDLDADGTDDYMIQLGGFTPDPMNDVWLTKDGVTWSYAGEAPWEPRGWHQTTSYAGALYMMGGSPLNNEVWRLDTVTKYDRPHLPSTRAFYLNYTYEVNWTQIVTAAEWSPRCGFSLVTQKWFNHTDGETITDSTERMLVMGGYGGYLSSDTVNSYDGMRTRSDVWHSTDGGVTWTMLTDLAFSPRGWMGAYVHFDPSDDRVDIQPPLERDGFIDRPPRIFVVGGGHIGGSTFSTRVTTKMIARSDTWWTRDGQKFYRVNYEQGAGTRGYDKFVQFYSSEPWTSTVVDSATSYLGMWGHTIERVGVNHSLILLAGDKGGSGALEQRTWGSLPGIFCDINGLICSGHGECGGGVQGCVCEADYLGEYCEIEPGDGA